MGATQPWRHGALWVLVSLWLLPGLGHAAARPAPVPAPAKAGAAKPVTKPAPRRLDPSGLTTEQLLTAAAKACNDLEVDDCLVLCAAVQERPEVPVDDQVAVYAHQGAAYAILGDIVAAERPYRLLLRLRPDFDLPAETPPKILAVFRKVQSDEKRMTEAVAVLARKNALERLVLDVNAPRSHRGGTPLEIRVRVVDPLAGVKALQLRYRTRAQAPYATLPFQADALGLRAAFTANQTAADQPQRLEYYVEVVGQDGGMLTSVGSDAAPRVIEVSPGQPPGKPLWQQPWSWAVGGGATAVLGVGAVTLTVLAAVAVVVGSTTLYLLLRGDGVPRSTWGNQYV